MIDKQGVQVIPCIYSKYHFFNEGLMKVEIGGKHGFVDKRGAQVIPCIYDYAHCFVNGIAKIRVGKTQGEIDRDGNQVIPRDFHKFPRHYGYKCPICDAGM